MSLWLLYNINMLNIYTKIIIIMKLEILQIRVYSYFIHKSRFDFLRCWKHGTTGRRFVIQYDSKKFVSRRDKAKSLLKVPLPHRRSKTVGNRNGCTHKFSLSHQKRSGSNFSRGSFLQTHFVNSNKGFENDVDWTFLERASEWRSVSSITRMTQITELP